MKKQISIHALLGLTLALGLTACGDDSSGDGDATADTGDTDDTDSSASMTATTTTATTTTATTTTATTTTTTDTDPDTTDTDPDTTDTDPTGDDGYAFPKDPYDAYTQIDRHGAVEAGTAGILASAGLGFGGEDLSVRDAYNASNPVEDAALVWFDEIAASVTFFHDALDDDIIALGLEPATIEETVAQAGPVIIPDTIKYDPSMPTAYPNGRTLEDQVVDITLAAVLLDLGAHPLDTFASLPLNPAANDVDFEADFPYLAPPNVP